MKLYSIYDTVAKEYSAPFIAKNDGVAMRMFDSQVEEWKKQGMTDKLIDQYTIMCLGMFDSESGLIQGYNKPECLSIDDVVVEVDD